MAGYLRVEEKGTSVKAIGVIQEPTANAMGLCDFIYRDQYSVFDWGVMPLPDGAVMDNRPVAVVAAFNYEMLGKLGVPVAYLGVAGRDAHDADTQPLDQLLDCGEIPSTLRMRMVHVLRPRFDAGKKEWDYGVFRDPSVKHYVHPIEFIWRAEAGPDSSFWKNIDAGVYSPPDFGLPGTLNPGDPFLHPILDHSSKYERHDRYFSPITAQRLAHISTRDWDQLCAFRIIINRALSDHAASAGLHRPDGKQEFSGLALVDVAGTWHEDRFEYTTAGGVKVKVSKQTPRDLHKLRSPVWAEQCGVAKKRAEAEGIENWKTLVDARPEPLEREFFEQYNNLMHAATNAWVGRAVFSGASPLEEACQEFDRYLRDYKWRLERAA